MLNSCVTDTVHDANQQLTGMIIPRTQDNDRERELPDPPRGQGPRALPQRAGRAQVRLHGHHEPGPHRHRSRRWMIRWKPALNAFDIAFDGRLTTGRK